jgi:hypothetical protein
MIEKDSADELTTNYVLRRFKETLEADPLFFKKLGGDISPPSRWQQIKRRVRDYVAHLWKALKGEECDDGLW